MAVIGLHSQLSILKDKDNLGYCIIVHLLIIKATYVGTCLLRIPLNYLPTSDEKPSNKINTPRNEKPSGYLPINKPLLIAHP